MWFAFREDLSSDRAEKTIIVEVRGYSGAVVVIGEQK